MFREAWASVRRSLEDDDRDANALSLADVGMPAVLGPGFLLLPREAPDRSSAKPVATCLLSLPTRLQGLPSIYTFPTRPMNFSACVAIPSSGHKTLRAHFTHPINPCADCTAGDRCAGDALAAPWGCGAVSESPKSCVGGLGWVRWPLRLSSPRK